MRTIFVFIIAAFMFLGCGDSSKKSSLGPQELVIYSSEWDLSKIVPIDSVRALPAGTIMFVRTAFDANGMRDMEVKLVRVLDDFYPPIPMIMFEASDPLFLQIGGAASGMSGSPVFLENGIVGALSMGPSYQTKSPYYFMATPIEWMLSEVGDRVRFSAKPIAIAYQGREFVPLGVRYVASGMALSGFGERLQKQMRDFAARQGIYFAFSQSLGSAGSGDFESEFVPGSPLAVGLVVGDEVNIAGVGTVTYVYGNKVVGFGHPMLGSGATGLPIIGARILAEISGLDSPFKFFTLDNRVLGTITVDRTPGIGGFIGPGPEMAPLTLDLSLSGEDVHLEHKMAQNGVPALEQMALSMSALFSPVGSRIDDELNQSVRVRTEISFRGQSKTYLIDNTRLFSSAERLWSLLSWDVAESYMSTLWGIINNPDEELTIARAHLSIAIIDSALYGRLDTVAVDTLVLIGDQLDMVAKLRVARREDRDVPISIAIPDTFIAGTYELLVGSAMNVNENAESNEFGMYLDVGIDDLIARENMHDERVVLKALLRFYESEPDTAVAMQDSLAMPDSLGYGALESSATTADSVYVGIVLEGVQSYFIHLSKKEE